MESRQTRTWRTGGTVPLLDAMQVSALKELNGRSVREEIIRGSR
jgi:hypothetical protein